MKGAIIFSGQYGSTDQYAHWIGEATGLPVFDVNDGSADLSTYDYLVLGSSVIVYKLTIRKWAQRNLSRIKNKPIILFTVSGAGPGPKLEGWVADSLPKELTEKLVHVALRGRMDPTKLGWWIKLTLKIGAWRNDDPEAKRQELEGFDFMDKSSIKPILNLVQDLIDRD